jgi:DNA-binding transcriptional LysR family regulator
MDLNLLVSLDALLEERSVVRAAKRVGLSPSAMSHSLGRLRDLFDDALLVRSAAGMLATPRAEALHRHVRQALDCVRAALEELPEFDPASSTRAFRMSASDDIQAMILPPLLQRLSKEGPDIKVVTSDAKPAEATAAALANGELDAAIGQFRRLPLGIHQELLFETRIVCLVRSTHPRIQGRLTLRQYLEEGHVAVRPRMDPSLDLDDLLGQRGEKRRIVASVCSLEVAPLVVAHTDFICSAAERVVEDFVEDLQLQMLDHPADPPSQKLYLFWPDRLHASPTHRWFRTMLQESIGVRAPRQSAETAVARVRRRTAGRATRTELRSSKRRRE